MKTLLVVLLLSVCVFAQVKKPEPPAVKVPYDRSLQTVVVTTKDWNDIAGIARLYERKDTKSKWTMVGEQFPVVVGSGGLAWGDKLTREVIANKIKKEGDSNSPAGLFPLTSSFGTGVKPNAVELPYTRLEQYTECVDDPKSNFYNRIVNRMQVGNFDWKSSEKMLAVGDEYALGVFVGYNSFPVEADRGSCIFLHVWKDAASGTSGCTAMERRNVERIVGWATIAKNPYIVQLTESDYKKYQKSWKLPKL